MTNNPSDQPMKKMKEGIVVCPKNEQTQSTPQPFIIGNANAASLFASALGGTQHNMIIPSNLMGLPQAVNNNQVVGILPVLIQGSNVLPNQKVITGNANSFGMSQGSVQLNNIHFDAFKGTSAHNNSHSNPQIQVVSNSNPDQLIKLTASDTVILPSSASDLASADTLPLFISSSSERNISVPVTSMLQPQSIQSSAGLQTSFSLVSGLSNKSISLKSIPTISLFKPDEDVSRRNELSLEAAAVHSGNLPNPSITSLQMCQTTNTSALVGGDQTSSKQKISESEGNKLEIDVNMDDDTDGDTNEPFDQEEDKRQNSLTRDDTIILPDATIESNQASNKSSLTEADTLIMFSQTVTGVSSRPIMTSAGLNFETNNLMNTAMSLSDNVNPPSRNSSLQTIPTLMLTDSIVGGNVNPSLLFNLLSQPSENQIPSSIKYLTLDEFLACNPNASMISSLQNSLSQSPQSLQTFPLNLSNSSVKGTQTDWTLGNSTVYFKPIATTETSENTEDKGMDERMVNAPVTVICEDKEPSVSVSMVNLVPQNQDVLLMNVVTPQDSSLDKNDENNDIVEPMDSELPFQCPECKDRFSSKRDLEKHEKLHKKILKCDLCTATFTRAGNYTRHRKIHNLRPESENVFTCDQCGRNFLQRCDLKRHELIHKNEHPYRCGVCNKGYIRRSDLVVHMRFHNKEKVFKCNMCDKSFYQSGDLSRHVRHVHKPNTQLTCGHCNRKYACETTLIRHMKVVHKDIILKTVEQDLKEPE